MKDYIGLLDGVLEKMEILSAWRFWVLVGSVPVSLLVWRLPEIIAALK